MIYRVIGTMSGSSMDGLDIAYCVLEEVAGKWEFRIEHAQCVSFDEEWKRILSQLNELPARDLLRAHTHFGHWMGTAISEFITTHQLEHKVHLIASHGHTVFHEPGRGMTFQMGDGAAIAASTKLPVVSDLRNMDVALGGQGAPIVPIGEKFLWPANTFFLNIGGIANISYHGGLHHVAFDICPANRMLNSLSNAIGNDFDIDGMEAAKGKINESLLDALNALPYYRLPFPKSLANEFGTQEVQSIVERYSISVQDKLRTVCEHIAMQVQFAVQNISKESIEQHSMMITGGGAFNRFLVQCIKEKVKALQVQIHIPEATLVQYKEALVMGFIGVLRWREEVNVLASVTGASRNSVGGALWMGQE